MIKLIPGVTTSKFVTRESFMAEYAGTGLQDEIADLNRRREEAKHRNGNPTKTMIKDEGHIGEEIKKYVEFLPIHNEPNTFL